MNITVSIVEDDEDLRKTLEGYVNAAGGFCCVSTHGSAEDALHAIPQLKPNVILMDIHLPGKNGIRCIAELKMAVPASKAIVLTSFEDTDLIFEALKAGALGYLLKGVRPAKLLESLREVHEGGSPMSSQIARKVVAYFHPPAAHSDNSSVVHFSEREQQVLDCLVRGLLYKQIAAELSISMGSVRTYLQRVYEKLQVHTRTEALLKYLNKGCVPGQLRSHRFVAKVRK